MKNGDIVKKLDEALRENDIYAEVYNDLLGLIAVDIEWGDWKHDHLFCKQIASELNLIQEYENCYEEDGSDCYSAIHYFRLIDEEE